MNKYKTRLCAAEALKSNVYNWIECSKKQRNDAQLLLIALNEIVNVRYCADEWDMMCFSCSPRLKEKFIEALELESDSAEQVRTLIRLIEEMEDPSFFHAHRSREDNRTYLHYGS